MDNGWIKLYRKSIDNRIYKHDPTAWRVFCHFLLLVNRKTGSYDFGRFVIAKELEMNPITFYKATKRLENAKMVTLSSNNKYTTISICNWSEYQGDDNISSNNTVTTKEQQSNTKQELRIKNKEIILHSDVAVADDINKVIKLFGSINPSYERLFKLKAQRDATSRLLGKMTYENISTLVEAARQANGQPYAPTITTPCQLEDKLGQLKSFYDKNKKKEVKVWKA